MEQKPRCNARTTVKRVTGYVINHKCGKSDDPLEVCGMVYCGLNKGHAGKHMGRISTRVMFAEGE